VDEGISQRTTGFPLGAPDLRLEVRFEPSEGGTRVTLLRSELPDDGMQYYRGRIGFYFEPMKAYFNAPVSE
jgi:hypothetical protein